MLRRVINYSPIVVSVSIIFTVFLSGFAEPARNFPISNIIEALFYDDTIKDDTSDKFIELPYPIKDNSEDPLSGTKSHSLDFENPKIFKDNLEFNPSSNNYSIYRSLSGDLYGEKKDLTLEEYLEQDNRIWQKQYFKERAKAQNFVQGNRSLIQDFDIKIPKVIDDIIGGSIDIKPQGSAELIFSYDHNKVENPAWSQRQQSTGQFKFDQKIKLSVRGNIGNAISLGIGYDTESSFEFDNEINLKYEPGMGISGDKFGIGKGHDGIIKIIEAGNVSLPVQGSLISGSQSLFGIKTKLQFGRLMVTSVFSQQKSEKKEITLENGSQKTTYDISALDYDVNKHFFLNQDFRDKYEQSLQRLPIVTSSIQISRIEVWIVNRIGATHDVRNIVAFMDLGEPNPWNSDQKNPQKGTFVVRKSGYPGNNANTLYENITADESYRSNSTTSFALSALKNSPNNFFNGQDYIKIDNAKKLSNTEYTVNELLGYISLNQRLNTDEALAVAYEYTDNGVRFQVGEFAQDVPPNPSNPNVLFLKMLKSTSTRTDLPLWDLMMKNIYSLGAYQVQQNEFRLDIIYEDDKSGANLTYIPETTEKELSGKILLQVLGLDRLNSKQEEYPDGIFDFLDGRTILQGTGKIVFPYLEPFGQTLIDRFDDPELATKYAFEAIYDSTQVQAEQQKQYDKFYLRGHYLGASGSEISLNAINVPEGSVKVTAGGMQLRENIDYTVDYTLGRVKILNESILNSGQVIKISAESNTLFSIQQKTLIGSRFDYRVTEDFHLGSTILYLKEKPLTQKVNIGDEPINNVIIGFDGTYRTDSRFLTKLVDKIPLIETKEKSELYLNGEFAQIIPGHPKVIGPKGVSYMDDFEGSEVPYDLRTRTYWVLASTPQDQPLLFPNGNRMNEIGYNFGRAKLAWYHIDELFYRSKSITPRHIIEDKDMRSKHSMREVREKEVFPNKQLPSGVPQTLRTFDLAYYPNERGPYNYDYNSLNSDGTLQNPEDNWGGIMRKIETNDFEAANIEYIEFWLMDPFRDNPGNPQNNGVIYIHLGDISEDILRDGVKQFENGLPKDGDTNKVNQTAWGNVPIMTPINYAFDNDPEARKFQDVGLDGLDDEQEKTFFYDTFISKLSGILDLAPLSDFIADPSNDNYHFFRADPDSEFEKSEPNILERYKKYNNSEQNSPVSTGGEINSTGSLNPDVEDINNDFTLNQVEAYYQYKIELRENMVTGENYIVSKQPASVELPNGKVENVIWYQFKIPIRSYSKRVGQIRDFRSVRFMRLILTDFEEDVVCRFARLQLVRGDWRQYLYDLGTSAELAGPGDPIDEATFDISTVNWEANGQRDPIPYVIPPGIEREVDYTTTELLEQNEQSLSFSVCDLEDGDARAAYKNTSFDVRMYKRLRMYVHAEGQNLKYGDLALFIRLGTDFSSHYYEYEIPLDPTDYGVSINSPELIWKKRNEINIAFNEFFRVKQLRDINPNARLSDRYTVDNQNGPGKVTVIGNPDLSNIKMIMVGIRNPHKDDNDYKIPPEIDDGLSKCGIIWINELRVTDFDEKGGWAAVGSITAKLADFGKVTLSANRTTIGFGGIEQKLQERSKDDILGYDLQSYAELGKFFPQKAGVKIPMYFNYSEQFIRPQYNPLSPDILLESRIALAETKEEKDSIQYAAETYVSRKSLNFMNVQKLKKGGGKTRIYSVENFIISYAYSDIFKRDHLIEKDEIINHRFMFNYNYNFPEKNLTPFRKFGKSKYLQLVRDINIGLRPQAFSFRTELDRRYGEKIYRRTGDILTLMMPIYDKSFTIKRIYDFRYNLTRSLRFNYTATADLYLEEPPGEITDSTQQYLREHFFSLSRMKNFNQRTSLTYDVPLRKFPLTNWLSMRSTLTGNYNWQQAPPSAQAFGNVIQNSQSIQLNGQANFITLYSKVPFLRTIAQGRSNVGKIKKNKLKELQEKEKEKGNKDYKELDEGDVTMNEGVYNVVEGILRVITSVKNINVNYQRTDGTVLPGFRPKPTYIGNDWDGGDDEFGDPYVGPAPGLPFVFGIQPSDTFRFKQDIIRYNWLTSDTSLNILFRMTHTENLTIQGHIEPIKGLKINLDMNRRYSENHQEIFRKDIYGQPEVLSPLQSGSFSMSYWSIGTALRGKWDEDISQTYKDFENSRIVVARKLSQDRLDGSYIDTTGFPIGYSRTSQQVIIPAFMAAYSNKTDASKFNFDAEKPFPTFPAPNWRITYNGLSKLDFIKKYARNININHAYRSTFKISSFSSNLTYNPQQDTATGVDIIPMYNIQQIAITEQLSPLIGIDINWVNNWTTRIEYRASRTISFSFSNFQTTEVRGRDFTIGIGYRAKRVKLPSFIKYKGKPAILEHDLNFRFDFSLKNNRSVINRLDEEISESIGGNRIITIKPVVDYVLSKNLTVRFFFTYNATKPVISTSYPTAFTNGGFSLRYTLGQ